MSSAEEDRWDDEGGWGSSDVFDDYHEPFRVPGLDEDTRALANREVEAALEAFKMQTPMQTFLAKARFALFWAGYKPRLVLAILFVRIWTKLTKADNRLVSQKTWRALKL